MPETRRERLQLAKIVPLHSSQGDKARLCLRKKKRKEKKRKEKIYDLYEKSHKTLVKEIKELNKWRYTPCSWLERFNLVYKFNVSLIKMPASHLMYVDKLILKFIWRGKRPRISKLTLMKSKIRGLTLHDFKT